MKSLDLRSTYSYKLHLRWLRKKDFVPHNFLPTPMLPTLFQFAPFLQRSVFSPLRLAPAPFRFHISLLVLPCHTFFPWESMCGYRRAIRRQQFNWKILPEICTTTNLAPLKCPFCGQDCWKAWPSTLSWDRSDPLLQLSRHWGISCTSLEILSRLWNLFLWEFFVDKIALELSQLTS